MSLLAYVAVQRMPNRIKAQHILESCRFKIRHAGSVLQWVLDAMSLLVPPVHRGQCPGWTNKFHRPIQAAKWFFWSPVATEGQRGWRVRQQSLWFILKSIFSFCVLLSLFLPPSTASVTGSCPPPCHNSPDTSHLIRWCPPGSRPRAWHRWSCWSPFLWHSPQMFESWGGQQRLALTARYTKRDNVHKMKQQVNFLANLLAFKTWHEKYATFESWAERHRQQ